MRKVALLATILMWTWPAAALQGEWFVDPKSECRVWSASPAPGDAISWRGHCGNGLAEGGGMLQWFQKGKPSGRYEGQMLSGKASGRGSAVWPTGEHYDGQWRDGMPNGRGTYVYANGDRYEGEMLDGHKNGAGAQMWVTGERFEGRWVNDRPQGFGVYRAFDGQTYTGEWRNGCFQQGDSHANVVATQEECGFK